MVNNYRVTGASDWYGKDFDDTPDFTAIADAPGRVQVGRNPFAAGSRQHTYGISTMVTLVKAEAGEVDLEIRSGHRPSACVKGGITAWSEEIEP